MILPCAHPAEITGQIIPTINLLKNLSELHPEVLAQHNISAYDYKNSLVFRSAVESIRGQFISGSTAGRQGMIGAVLAGMVQQGLIQEQKATSTDNRHDFFASLLEHAYYPVAIEVKGGEGNSINISERPAWAKEFALWCHLDGAIVNQPARSAQSIINRINNEVRRGKIVDALFFKDAVCGTRLRPCPKYPGSETTIGLGAAPDVFLFPKVAPNLQNPEPELHTLESLELPKKVLAFFGVPEIEMPKHVWHVHIKLADVSDKKGPKVRTEYTIKHKDRVLTTGSSKSWALK